MFLFQQLVPRSVMSQFFFPSSFFLFFVSYFFFTSFCHCRLRGGERRRGEGASACSGTVSDPRLYHGNVLTAAKTDVGAGILDVHW